MKQLALPLALFVLLAGSACSTQNVAIPEAAFSTSPVGLPTSSLLSMSRGDRRRGDCVLVRCTDDDAAFRCASACEGRWVRKIRGTNCHLIEIGRKVKVE